MSRLRTFTILCASWALLSPAHAEALAPPPETMKLDGQVTEWTLSHTLGAAQQTAGSQTVGSEEDYKAALAVAMDADGFYIAARVRDDRSIMADSEADDRTRVRSDHLELWLSFDEPLLPEKNWEMGTITANDCRAESEPWESNCMAWLEDTEAHEARLKELFLRQYLILPDGVYWARNGGESLEKMSESSVNWTQTSDGYTIEVQITAADLPATRQLSLQTVRWTVDGVDNDLGHASQESFLSLSPDRSVDQPDTFVQATLDEPLAATDRAGIISLLAADRYASWAWIPTAPIREIFRFDVFIYDSWRNPEPPWLHGISPVVIRTDINGEEVARMGEYGVHLLGNNAQQQSWWSLSVTGPTKLPQLMELSESSQLMWRPSLVTFEDDSQLRILSFQLGGSMHDGMDGSRPELRWAATVLTEDGQLIATGAGRVDRADSFEVLASPNGDELMIRSSSSWTDTGGYEFEIQAQCRFVPRELKYDCKNIELELEQLSVIGIDMGW